MIGRPPSGDTEIPRPKDLVGRPSPTRRSPGAASKRDPPVERLQAWQVCAWLFAQAGSSDAKRKLAMTVSQLAEVSAHGAVEAGVALVFDQFLPYPAGRTVRCDLQQGRDHIDQFGKLPTLSRSSKGIGRNLGGHMRITLGVQNRLGKGIRGVHR